MLFFTLKKKGTYSEPLSKNNKTQTRNKTKKAFKNLQIHVCLFKLPKIGLSMFQWVDHGYQPIFLGYNYFLLQQLAYHCYPYNPCGKALLSTITTRTGFSMFDWVVHGNQPILLGYSCFTIALCFIAGTSTVTARISFSIFYWVVHGYQLILFG